jgi:hypothetical protein
VNTVKETMRPATIAYGRLRLVLDAAGEDDQQHRQHEGDSEVMTPATNATEGSHRQG